MDQQAVVDQQEIVDKMVYRDAQVPVDSLDWMASQDFLVFQVHFCEIFSLIYFHRFASRLTGSLRNQRSSWLTWLSRCKRTTSKIIFVYIRL